MPPASEPGIPSAHRAAIAGLARMHAWELSGEPKQVPQSVSNANYRVETVTATWFVRAHRPLLPRERIEREHAAMAWAGERGIPVAPPLSDESGRTVHSIGGTFWSVFPWVEGRSLLRGAMTPGEAGSLGAMNGRLHAVLADWPAGDLHRNSELSWDTEKSIADLSRVDDLIRYYPAQTEEQLQVQGWLRDQLELLEGGAARPASDFAGIPVQPTHGDPHERNLMVGATGEPVAVVDWERFCLNPPAFEVLRTLTFAHLLDEPLITAFLAGYRAEHRLDAGTIAPCVEFWWQSQLHNTWAYRDRFIKGNRAVEQFFGDGAAALRRFSDAGYRTGLAETLHREAS
jgi:Ser/Thr protein kinase RdoA (MazF antagonist)